MDHRTIVSFFTCQLVWVNRYRPTLLAPVWCENRWTAMAGIASELARSGAQGHSLGRPFSLSDHIE